MFNKIKLGLMNLDGYGPHPGTEIIIMLIIFGGLAGSTQGIKGIIGGCLVMMTFYLPPYLFGAYERGKSYLKDKEKTK